jgi:transposase
LSKEAVGEVVCCYEAGPCGYGLQRTLVGLGVRCLVVAPSLVPRKPGERIKTDRRDGRKLAGQLRAGELTEVLPPTPREEGVRDLCRAREDVRIDLGRCRHRLQKMLLRRGIQYSRGRAWTLRYRQWLWSLRFDDVAEQVVFDDYLRGVELCEERLIALEEKLEEISREEPYAEPVAMLRCFRGIDTVTAMTVVGELYGFGRFHSARQLMAFLGLVPSVWSSGRICRRGGITKMGNRHVRRVLIEAAWHYRHKPRVGAALRARRQGQPGQIIALADKAQQRLHRRFWRLLMQGKTKNVATTAVARELAGFIWAVLYPMSAKAA